MGQFAFPSRVWGRLALGALVVAGLGCGSVPESTSCVFEGSCGVGVIDATPPDDTGTAASDSNGADTACTPGATKREDCNECVCSAAGDWLCTTRACADTAPPPSSTCPPSPAPGEKCLGHPHCRYTDPCTLGCDCVDEQWVCGHC